MWTKPYGMKEGFLIGGGLIIAGLMLELSVGLSHLCALPAITHSQASACPVRAARLVCALSDVLVGHQLPALGSGLQRACI